MIMENEKMEQVSYTLYEAAQARADRRFKQMLMLVIIVFAALILTNAGWLIHESQYEDVVTTVSQNATSDSGDAIINGDKAGAVIYGIEGESDGNN